MKIVFCMYQMIMGGVEKVLCQYLSELSKYKDIECTVLCKKKILEPYFIDFFSKNNIHYIDGIFLERRWFFLFNIYRKFYNKYRRRWVAKYLNQFDVVVDFFNFCALSEIKNVGKAKIGFYHGSFTLFSERPKPLWFSEYDKIVCLSDSFKNDFQHAFPDFVHKIMRLYNPIDVRFVQKEAEKENKIFDTSVPYFIAVQRVDEDKDVATVICAFQIFSEKNKRVRLYVVGKGPELSAMKELAKDNPNIIFTGQVNHVLWGIKNAQALILSSTTTVGEGLPNVLLEAQTVGTLAISSDVKSGPAEILMNGEAGVLFEPRNYQQLAQIMEDVIQHKEKYQSKIDCATQNLSRFDAKLIVQELLNQIEILKKEKEQVL